MKFDSIIDIGCGDGKVTREIKASFPMKEVIGVDYSEKSLQFARAFSPHIPFLTKTEKQFDAFVLVEVFEFP